MLECAHHPNKPSKPGCEVTATACITCSTRALCVGIQTSKNDYKCTPLAVCRDSQVRDLLLDVNETGATARTALVRQIDAEAAEAAAAEAARRLLEQRMCASPHLMSFSGLAELLLDIALFVCRCMSEQHSRSSATFPCVVLCVLCVCGLVLTHRCVT